MMALLFVLAVLCFLFVGLGQFGIASLGAYLGGLGGLGTGGTLAGTGSFLANAGQGVGAAMSGYGDYRAATQGGGRYSGGRRPWHWGLGAIQEAQYQQAYDQYRQAVEGDIGAAQGYLNDLRYGPGYGQNQLAARAAGAQIPPMFQGTGMGNWMQQRLGEIQAQGSQGQPGPGGVVQQAQALGQRGMGLSEGYYGGAAPAQRWQRGTGYASAGLRGLPGAVARQGAQIQQGYGQLGSELGGAYDRRLQTGMGMLEGYGAQQREDIGRTFGAAGSTAQANLAARGLGGTTIAGDVGRAYAGEESREARRLGEDVQRMRTGLYADLSGQGLLARERVGAGALASREAMAGLGAQTGLGAYGALGEMGMAGAMYQDRGMQNRLENMMGYGRLPIQTQFDLAQMGMNFYGPLNRVPPERWSI